jgi:tRNA nucleotidyltransferase (CCA-adding enzyme)
LLGSSSNDIDVALEDMMGHTFAESFVEFVRGRKGLAAKAVSKVESNPDQSKHLETAKTTVLGTELDFVNLRSEEYAGDSRIPTEVVNKNNSNTRCNILIAKYTKAFGTPLQDALRRDITINALFYNVHTRTVEDHTGQGLGDLRNGVIRTPLPPKQTFTDDPLRVIRCIRFATRFGFALVPELREAASDPAIKVRLT